MPNNKYVRSTKKERDLVNSAADNGADVALRSAGSKSKGRGYKTDVVVVDHRDKRVDLIQVKTKVNHRIRIEKDVNVYTGYTVRERLISYE
jgi:Holliday junction resolvase